MLLSKRGDPIAGLVLWHCPPAGDSNSGRERLRSILGRSAGSDRVSEPEQKNYTPSFITKGDTHSVTLEEGLALKFLTDRGTHDVLEREKQITFG